MQSLSVCVVKSKMRRVKRKVFFCIIKILLILAFIMKPHNIARGEKVYHNTTIQNPVIKQNELPERHDEIPAEVVHPRYREVVCNISAYTAHSDETGRGDGITASGVMARAGRTIAMDNVPFGTKVEIDGHMYTVEDRFGGGYHNRIDIYMNTKEEAFRWGRRHLTVKIYE